MVSLCMMNLLSDVMDSSDAISAESTGKAIYFASLQGPMLCEKIRYAKYILLNFIILFELF